MPKNPHADFTPALEGYSGQGKFRFWCQMALPLTYDDSLSYYELLCKVVNYLNNTIEDVADVETNVSRLSDAYTQLQNYVNDYFDDLDVEAELRNVLDAMAEDGTLDDLLDPLVQDHLPSVVNEQIDDVVADQIDDAVAGQINDVVAEQLPPLVDEGIPGEVSDWLTANVNPVGSAVVVDSSLTISGAAADAKVTGDELADLKTQLSIYAGNSQIDFTSGGYITTNQGVGQTVTLTPETAVLMSYAIVDCVEGDNFTINGVGTSAGRAWAFIDSSNKILTVADASITLENVTVVAPENANKCILNLVIASRGVCLKGKLQTAKNTETDSEIAAIKTDIDNIKQFDSDLFDEFSNNLLLKGTIEERTYYKGSTGVKDYPNNALFSVVNIPLKDVVKDLYLGQSMFTYSDSVPAAAEGNTARSIAFYDKNGDYVGGGEPYSQPAAVKYGVNIPATAVTMNVSFYYANGTSYPNAVKPTVYWAYTEKVLEEYEYFSPENKVKTISIIDIDKNNHADFVSARRPTICFTLDGNYPRTQAIIDIAEAHGYRIGIAPKWNQSFNEAVAENARYYPISKFLEWQDNGHEILSHMGLDLSPSTSLTDEQAISCIRTSYLSAIERGFKVKGAIGSAGNVADKFIPYVQRWYSYGSTLNNHSEYAGGTPELAFLSTEPYRMWRYSMQQSTLDGMKDAVDDAITNNGLLIFYGHALDNSQVVAEGHVMEDPDTYGDNPDTPGSTTNLAGTDHFTEDNFDALLTYIDGKVSEGACQVNIPYYAVNEYYKLRKSDFTWT